MESSKLKKRLVGAAVLLSLAVIMLPLLVDYQREPERRFTPVEVPKPPAYRDYPSRVVPIKIPVSVAQKIEQGVVSRQLAAAERQEVEPKIKPERDVDAGLEPKKADPETDSLDHTVSLDKGWVVQVGTFKNPDGAKRLASKLKALGFVVYIEPLQLSTGPMSRVRIGPELLREDALAQQLKLQEITDFNGAVLRFP